MQILENISLLPYNTFRMDVRAEKMAIIRQREDLEAWTAEFGPANQQKLPPTPYPLHPNPYPLSPIPHPLILGGGSNILFTKDVQGWVLKNEIKGIRVVQEDEEHVHVEAGGGEPWHGFVMHCIENGWGGLENLSLIPGNTGASPMQNIGAYGVEIKDVFDSLEAWHIGDRAWVRFNGADCQFGYRESVFKRALKDQFVISSVTYRLQKKPVLHLEYGAIREELERAGVQEPTIRDVSDAVIRIRSSKLPDPARIGNAGSFFKNPEVGSAQFEALKQQWPGIVGYSLPGGNVKLAAGWLIEKAGWKGFRSGDAGCHDKQALVLVNYGHASGSAIYDLSEQILQDVNSKFGVTLEREVNIC
jgi:UDP-N-acetylmuramate dehydrogenase